MRQQLCLWLLLVGAIGAQCVDRKSVFLVDSNQGTYLQESGDAVEVDGKTLSSMMSALSGLMPPSEVDSEASSTIEQVVKPSPLRKPKAHMVFNVAGLSEDVLLELFAGKQSRAVQLLGDESAVTVVVESLANIAQSNPGVSVSMLDHQGLQGCAGNCIDEHMPSVAHCMDAKHDDSTLTFSSGAMLDFGNLPDKLFAVEAASLYSGLQAQLQRAIEEDGDLHMLETTLVGLHGLEYTYGADSEVVSSARQAVKALLKWSIENLDAKYNNDVTYQVTGISSAAHKGTVQEIMGWKQDARRRLAAAETTSAPVVAANSGQWPPADEVKAAKMFTAKACGYGGFVLLVYFTLAGIWCMCYMPMKQDTMLFGAKKTE